jgi:hypothetical protein
MNPGENVEFLVLFVQEILEFSDLSLEGSYSILQRFGIATRKCSSAQFVTGLAFKTNVGALRALWTDAITPDLLAPAPVASLGYPALCIATDPDHLHWQDTRHL